LISLKKNNLGLPHAHILVILNDANKPKTTEDYDKIISAEIPDITVNPLLYDTITKFNIHGPCGNLNPKSGCMQDKFCTKNYPRDFLNETVTDENGYPRYRRRNTGTYLIRNKNIDNRWVVPYNPFLSTKYNCHINVEICSTIKAIKYIHKYIYKGSDRAICQIQKNELQSK
jgi:hypothetical protein